MDDAQAAAQKLGQDASKGLASTVSSISAGAAEAAEISDEKPQPRARSEALWQQTADPENPLRYTSLLILCVTSKLAEANHAVCARHCDQGELPKSWDVMADSVPFCSLLS